MEILIINILKIIVSLLVLYPALKFYQKAQKITRGPIIVEIPLVINLIIGIIFISGIRNNNNIVYIMQYNSIF